MPCVRLSLRTEGEYHLNSISQAGTKVMIVHITKIRAQIFDCCLEMLSHRLQVE